RIRINFPFPCPSVLHVRSLCAARRLSRQVITTERPHPTGGSCPREGHRNGKHIRISFPCCSVFSVVKNLSAARPPLAFAERPRSRPSRAARDPRGSLRNECRRLGDGREPMVAALHLVPGGFQQPAEAEGIVEIVLDHQDPPSLRCPSTPRDGRSWRDEGPEPTASSAPTVRSRTTNSLPRCNPSLRASIDPPCSSTIALTSVSPTPSPARSRSRVFPACTNGSKMCGRKSGVIPLPVSRTFRTSSPPSATAETSTRPPCGVNLKALLRRLKMTCSSRNGSASSCGRFGPTTTCRR